MPPAFPSLRSEQFLGLDKVEHISIVADGKVGTAMQAFRNILSAKEIAGVITYTLQNWDNSSTAKTQYISPDDALAYLTKSDGTD